MGLTVETGKIQAAKMPNNAPRLHLSTARIVSPLVNGCAMTIFFSFSVVAKSLSETSTAILVDVPMEPNSNPLVSIKNYFS
jgi:hypothetical protein